MQVNDSKVPNRGVYIGFAVLIAIAVLIPLVFLFKKYMADQNDRARFPELKTFFSSLEGTYCNAFDSDREGQYFFTLLVIDPDGSVKYRTGTDEDPNAIHWIAKKNPMDDLTERANNAHLEKTTDGRSYTLVPSIDPEATTIYRFYIQNFPQEPTITIRKEQAAYESQNGSLHAAVAEESVLVKVKRTPTSFDDYISLVDETAADFKALQRMLK